MVNINQIKVTFNTNVAVAQSDLLLTGVNVSSYNVSGGTFSYDPTTFTATWTLPQPIGPDKLMLALNADGSGPVQDVAGNHLDGEWTNPASTTATGGSVYPSGNGTAGGNFDFRFNMLPGDANQDGVVDVSDLGTIGVQWQQTGQGWTQGDFNGDGQVDVTDLGVVGANWQKTLPSGNPTAGSFPSGAALPETVVSAAVDAQGSGTVSQSSTPWTAGTVGQ